MKKKVLILHGWNGSDFPHWQAQLASDLIKENYEVHFPELPNKDFPEFQQWKEFVKKEVEYFKPNMVVCHSLGNVIWFHLLEELDIFLDKLMLVAPVRQDCDIQELKTFFPYKIPTNLKAKEVIMAVSDNDPYLSLEEAMKLQQELNIGMKIMENAGHINTASGFGKLDCALDWIKQELPCEETKS